jgi:hypothetical protein
LIDLSHMIQWVSSRGDVIKSTEHVLMTSWLNNCQRCTKTTR